MGRIADGAQRDYLYQHGLDLRDLLWRRPWSDLEVSSPAGDPDEGTNKEMPFYFGIGLLALLPLGLCGASAQTPLPRPNPQAPADETRSEAPPAGEERKQRDKELEALRAEQRKALETEASLKREIEAIGDDRRKFNQQIIESAARVDSVEERIAKTQERLEPLDDREQALRNSLQ